MEGVVEGTIVSLTRFNAWIATKISYSCEKERPGGQRKSSLTISTPRSLYLPLLNLLETIFTVSTSGNRPNWNSCPVMVT